MREVTEATKNFTRKDRISIRNGVALKDVDGKEIAVSKIAIGTDVDESTGEVKNYGAFITESGECYTFISSNAIECAKDLIEIVDDEGVITVKVEMRKSKQGRDFVSLILR